MWQRTRSHLDEEFKLEFARTFTHQRFAELRFANLLLDRGFVLEPAARGRPDFVTHLDGKRVWIEVITPSFGEAANPDRPPEKGGRTVRPSPERETLLRLTGALFEKKKKFDKYRENCVVSPDDICIIAVGGSHLFPYAEGVGLPRIVRALLPAGDEIFTIAPGTGEVLDVAHERRDRLARSGAGKDGQPKAPVATTAFLEREYAGISGVLYDSACVKSYVAPSDARFTYVHNRTATTTLAIGGVLCEAEYWAEAVGEDIVVRNRDQSLEPA